jgi:hypothetical protein
MNNVGFPLLLAQALATLQSELGSIAPVTDDLLVDFRMAPTRTSDVSRAHQKQEHSMRSRLMWEDEELGNCVLDVHQQSVDVVDREDFSRQTISQPEARDLRIHVDLRDPRDIDTAQGSAALSFDEDGELVIGEASPTLHDPTVHAMILHSVHDRLRACYDVSWQLQRQSEQGRQLGL